MSLICFSIGDGNSNNGWSTFIEVLKDALFSGWNVEVWSWRKSLSNNMLNLCDEYPNKMEVKYLDDKDIFHNNHSINSMSTSSSSSCFGK